MIPSCLRTHKKLVELKFDLIGNGMGDKKRTEKVYSEIREGFAF